MLSIFGVTVVLYFVCKVIWNWLSERKYFDIFYRNVCLTVWKNECITKSQSRRNMDQTRKKVLEIKCPAAMKVWMKLRPKKILLVKIWTPVPVKKFLILKLVKITVLSSLITSLHSACLKITTDRAPVNFILAWSNWNSVWDTRLLTTFLFQVLNTEKVNNHIVNIGTIIISREFCNLTNTNKNLTVCRWIYSNVLYSLSTSDNVSAHTVWWGENGIRISWNSTVQLNWPTMLKKWLVLDC